MLQVVVLGAIKSKRSRDFEMQFVGGNKTLHKMAEFLIQQGVEGGNFSSYGTDGVPDIAAG